MADDDADAGGTFRVHLLDVGHQKFGDCILVEVGGKVILIDGSHPGDYKPSQGFPSIPDQLKELFGHAAPFDLDLLVCTHAHVDHIGCLPRLVHDKTIRPKFAILADPQLGWGRSGVDAGFDEGLPDAVRPLAAALREESRADVPDSELREFLADSGGLEDNYKQMLKDLDDQHVTIARYGRDEQAVADIVSKLKSVGIKIYGPTQDQLVKCAEVIREKGRDSGSDAAAMMAEGMDVLQAYRLAASADAARDAADGGSVGAALNDMSIVISFSFQGSKALLTGDMQFVKPQVSDLDDMGPMLQAIADDAPFDFVKLGHHASNNAVSDATLDAYDAPWLGISTGRDGADHPNAAVLKILNARKAKSSWLRTDKNGLVTFDLSGNTVAISKKRGKVNDATPKSADQPMFPAVLSGGEREAELAAETGTGIAGVTTRSWTAGDGVEVIVRIPHETQLDVQMTLSMTASRKGGGGGRKENVPPNPAPKPTPDAYQLAGGRQLPPLLFLTSAEALRRNITPAAANAALAAIRASGHQLVDEIPAGADVLAVAQKSRAALQAHPNIRGVVIVGGFDVVPSSAVDALDAQLRSDVADDGFSDKEDNFFVWNDDIYGDRIGDQLPEVPVSRIPDGGSAQLVRAALGASPVGIAGTRFGIRNVARPFAEPVFQLVPGAAALLRSEPTTSGVLAADVTRAARVYFMLHGHYLAPDEFSGEDNGDYPVAFRTANVGAKCADVVFTGCCWGGLSVDRPAGMVVANGQPVTPRKAGDSIALSFLQNGSVAFIGCTGMHYSPLKSPYRHHGGRMHTYFWNEIVQGASPAQALFDAKARYVTEIPVQYGQPVSPSDIAIERKIWRQYTCLGLGWW